MKRFGIFPILGLALLALSACNVTAARVGVVLGAVQTLATEAGQQKLVDQTRAMVQEKCAYLPTAQTVIDIGKTFSPSTAVTLTFVEQVALGICAAVANPTVAYASGRSRKQRDGTFRNVPIRGQRTGQ